jgi:hypothetical protein
MQSEIENNNKIELNPRKSIVWSGGLANFQANQQKDKTTPGINKKNLKLTPKLKIFLITVFALFFVLLIFIILPLIGIKSSIDKIQSEGIALKSDLSSKNYTSMTSHVTVIQGELKSIRRNLDGLGFREILDNADLLISKAKPKIDTFAEASEAAKTASLQLDQSNQSDISNLVTVLPEALSIYTEVEPEIQILLYSINKLDPDSLPSFTPQSYKDKLISILTKTREVEKSYPVYSDLLNTMFGKLPDLLGSQKPVKYLLVLQNEKEMRASGGLLTSFGLITIDKGSVVGEIETRDMWDLQRDMEVYHPFMPYDNIYGQLALMNDGCGATSLRSQDSGIYPDLQVSMEMFTTYYDLMHEEFPGKYPEYDNVVIVNTFFASDMVSLIQPLVMDDSSVITADNLARVIFDNREESEQGQRKSNIGRVAKQAEAKFKTISSDRIPDIISTITKSIEAKNIAFYSKNPIMQQYFNKLGMTANLEHSFKGDYFTLSEAQVCAYKSNFYVKDTVTQNIKIADDGTVSKTVNVEWKNEKVYDPAEETILSALPNYAYRAWIRFITPIGTDFTHTDGYAKSRYIYFPSSYYDDEMQKDVSDNVIWFDHRRLTASDPVRTYNLNVAYDLPEIANYTTENGYRMLIQKHPGKKDEKYVIGLSHQGKDYHIEFVLDRDKVVSLKDGVIKVEDYASPLDSLDSIINLTR